MYICVSDLQVALSVVLYTCWYPYCNCLPVRVAKWAESQKVHRLPSPPSPYTRSGDQI